MTQKLDLLTQIPCYKCITLEPTRAPIENCNPNQCQTLTDWIMNEVQKQQTQEKHDVLAAPKTQQ